MPTLSRAAGLMLLTGLLLPLALPSAIRAAEAIDLTPRVAPNDLARVTIELEVGGTVRVPQQPGTGNNSSKPGRDGRSAEARELPMSVAAAIEYDEYRVAPRPGTRQDRLPGARGNLATRAIRWYDKADATLKVDAGGLAPKLADDHRLIVVENSGGRLVFSAARGLLAREELDLIDVTGDSLVVDGLMPNEPVADGDSWRADPNVIAGLLSLDSVASCEVASVLDKYNTDFALVRLVGAIVGTSDGAATEMEIRGVYLFDRRLRRITRFNLAVKENRSIGGATPGLDSVAKLRLGVKPITESKHLTDATLAALRTPQAQRLDLLRLDRPEQGYRVLHDRWWFVTSQGRESTSLRRVDHGDVVAQCTITSLPPKSEGRQTTLEEFERDIRFSLKENFGQLVSSRQWTNAFHHHALEVVVRGTVDEVPVEWHYYLVAPEASGHRVSVAVTIDGRMVDRLSGADRALVNAIQLVPIEEPADRASVATRESGDKSLVVPGR